VVGVPSTGLVITLPGSTRSVYPLTDGQRPSTMSLAFSLVPVWAGAVPDAATSTNPSAPWKTRFIDGLT
jgi:hypothetical protein